MASAIIIAFFFGPMIVIAGLMPVGRAGPLWWVLLFLAGLAPFGAIVLFNWWLKHWEQQEAIRVALEASRAREERIRWCIEQGICPNCEGRGYHSESWNEVIAEGTIQIGDKTGSVHLTRPGGGERTCGACRGTGKYSGERSLNRSNGAS